MAEELNNVPEEVIRKIKKLQNFAEGTAAIGNEAEATLYAGMVQKLLLQYQLEMSTIDFKSYQEHEPIGVSPMYWSDHRGAEKRKRSLWQQTLGGIVAHAFSCQVLVHERSNMLSFAGRKSKRELAIFTFVTLARAAENIAQREYDRFYAKCERDGSQVLARGYKNSFLLGFCQRIKERFEEEVSGKNAPAGAIVLVKKEAEASAAFIDANYTRKATQLACYGDQNHYGVKAGQQFASEMALRGGDRAVSGTAGKQQGRLQ